jgi:hypothetical protein
MGKLQARRGNAGGGEELEGQALAHEGRILMRIVEREARDVIQS